MGNWGEYYDNKLDLREYLGSLSNHIELFQEIVEKNPDRILEVGSGTGMMSIFLDSLGYKIISIDKDPEVVDQAKANAERFKSSAEFRQEDVLKYEPERSFDLAFSQGLMEHFDDDQINSIIEKKKELADNIIFSVPSYMYGRKDFGNERLLTKEAWIEIIEDPNFEAYYYGSRMEHILHRFRGLNYRHIVGLVRGMRPKILVKKSG
jgi:SAM-dependent methyltransferase